MHDTQHVLVSGLGVVSPIGLDLGEFAQSLRDGKSGIGHLPSELAESIDVKIGATLYDFVLDATLLKRYSAPESLIRPILKCTSRMPLSVQATVAATLQAWLQAGLENSAVDSGRIGIVVAGNNIAPRYSFEHKDQFVRAPQYFNPRYAYHYMDTIHIGVVSEIFGIHGEGFSVGGASSSGNMAIIKAAQAISSGVLDICLVVGAMADLSPMELQGFFNMGAIAGKAFHNQPDKACRPFDVRHEGFVFGQAAGCMVLESGDSVERRQATPLAEVAGTGVFLDANHLPNPDPEGEANAMFAALGEAGLDPGRVDYLNAHGTSSPLGDITEIKAIKSAFPGLDGHLWINSTKSLTGHCLSSAGVIEAIATVVQMQNGFLHPNRNLDEPIDDKCRFCGSEAENFQVGIAMSNSFGFGGINTSIVLKKEFCK
ncbi:MAG: beta-ketoacyl synthase N-terminal-like domain-containing protein [Candidatus Thiodiazotropha sp.]